mgnify:CR=1 FL=1
MQDAAVAAIRSGKHGYTPSAGIDPLREAAAQYMAGMRGGLPIRAQDVVVGAGAVVGGRRRVVDGVDGETATASRAT